MKHMGSDLAQQQCLKFLESLGRPGFIVVGWKKNDDSMEVIQSVKDMNPVEYMKAMNWAQNEVMEGL